MAFQPAPNMAKVAVIAENQGEACISTTHWFKAGAWGSGDIQALADTVKDIYNDLALPIMPATYVASSVEAKGIRTQIDVMAISEWNPLGVGAIAGTVSPNNVSLAVKFSGPFTGRSTRGRNFWPALLEINVNDNRVELSYVALIVSFYEDLKDLVLAGTGFNMVVCSRRTNGALREEAEAFGVTDISVEDNVVDSMRRRLPKRGA